LSIVIRVLQSSLAASRSHLSRLVNLKLFTSGQLAPTNSREEHKNVLTAAQDSAAVQLLLEACLETEDDRVNLIFLL
jgi:integrator complex subunit 2